MRHLDRYGLAPRQRPISLDGETADRRPNFIPRDGASMRMVAAMAERFLPASDRSLFEEAGAARLLTPYVAEGGESDAQYFSRRSQEECRAAGQAVAAEARAAHRELAHRYVRLSRAMRDQGSACHPRTAARARVSDVLRRRFGLAPGDPARPRASHALQSVAMEDAGTLV